MGESDNLERAKLNFNYGNALRQIDQNNVQQLEEAEHRLQDARTYFAKWDPQYLSQTG